MKTRVDLLIRNGLLFAHAGREPSPECTVAVRNGLILDLGSDKNLCHQYEAPTEIDATGCLILPGLVNTHTHIGMSCFRGLADDLPLMEWLHNHIFPAEAKTTAEQVYWSSMLSCAEMIRSGTTTFCDMYLFENEVAKACDVSGLRALVGEGLFGFPSPNYGSIDAGFRYTDKLVSSWQGHPRISISVAPHAPYTCSPALLGLAAKFARERNLPLHMHLSETQHEVNEMEREHGCRPVELMERIGFLGPDLIAAHCVWVNDAEMNLLAKRGVRVAHNPESNMKLAAGIAPVVEMLEKGIVVGLGSDGSASNNDTSMFSEMDFASKLQKVHRLDPTALPAAQVLRMATLGGAEVMGLRDTIGSIEPGKAADIIVLDLAKPHLQPFYHAASQVVYAAQASDVRDTIVQGKVLMRNRQILTFDEAEVFEHMKRIQKKVLMDIRK